MKRRKFSREFKIEACKLVLNQQQGIASTTRDLGVGESFLTKWVKAYRADPAGVFPGEGTPQVFNGDDRLPKLDLKRVTMEREILKKAMAYFVESTK